MKFIIFERLLKHNGACCCKHISRREIAFNEEHLMEKLDGEMAIVNMPAKPLLVQLWRKFFPLKFKTFEIG